MSHDRLSQFCRSSIYPALVNNTTPTISSAVILNIVSIVKVISSLPIISDYEWAG